MNGVNRLLSLDREDMSDFERELFLNDMKRVYDEYFEVDSDPSLEITRAENGFIICVLLTARRIKNVNNNPPA